MHALRPRCIPLPFRGCQQRFQNCLPFSFPIHNAGCPQQTRTTSLGVLPGQRRALKCRYGSEKLCAFTARLACHCVSVHRMSHKAKALQCNMGDRQPTAFPPISTTCVNLGAKWLVHCLVFRLPLASHASVPPILTIRPRPVTRLDVSLCLI